uniref:Platelet-derived growth factor (PDGF) family profile domain-containing protein n=1 Tax=Anopheles dirus TaxID=7168 RepID=A0A182NEB3_9DIPT
MSSSLRYPERYESLTDYKQTNFGNKLAVERSYNAYSNNGYARQQVMSHLQRINVEGKCKVPKPKLVPSSLDRSKVYMPHCTILHRCDDDTGCCMPMETCAPKTTTNITLYFYMGNVGSRQQHTVTTLTFSNHTECHCVRLDALQGLRSSRSQTQEESSLEHSTEGSRGSSGIAPASRCTCPRHFKSVNDNESNCFCDCISHDRDCIRFKEGFENFSMETRKCIRSKQCSVPRCEYGMYNRNEGRCPKKSDRINEQFPQYR